MFRTRIKEFQIFYKIVHYQEYVHWINHMPYKIRHVELAQICSAIQPLNVLHAINTKFMYQTVNHASRPKCYQT